MRYRPLTILSTLLLAPSPAVAAIINVPADQPSIKAAIQAASPGDEIVVADGTYTGVNNRGMSFGGKNLVVRSANGPAACIIDLQNADRAFEFANGETLASVVEGFTFTNGKAVGTWNRGGAIITRGAIAGAGPTIRDCVFTANSAGFGGAVAVFQTSAPIIENCVFEANTGTGFPGGGGLYCDGSAAAPIIRDCSFFENVSADCGGGMIALNSSPATVERCDFVGNTCPNLGGGVYNPTASFSKFLNCRFHGNTAGSTGGGIAMISGTAAILANCTFSANTAGTIGGGGLYVNSPNAAARVMNCTLVGNSAEGSTLGGNQILAVSANGMPISNCIIWGEPVDVIRLFGSGSPAITRCIVAGGYAGEGNLDVDPMLADVDGADDVAGTFDDDLRPLANSPAIDSGNNALYVSAPTTDLAGEPRMVDDPTVADSGLGDAPIIDRGAFEVQACALGDLDCDGDVDGADLGALLAAWGTGDPLADLDGDGVVDGADLGLLLGAWSV